MVKVSDGGNGEQDGNAMIRRSESGVVIGQRRCDGYINATALCQAARKEWSGYWRNPDAKAYADELSKSLQICRDLLVRQIGTGPNELRGTWVHPQLALHLAQWLSPTFAVKVSGWVFELLTTGSVRFDAGHQQHHPLSAYSRRVSLGNAMLENVPIGYWSVFHESGHLLLLVEHDMKLPVDKMDLLDGSIGKHWGSFRVAQPWKREAVKYAHEFPDHRGVHEAWAYHEDELKHFSRWLRGVYRTTLLLDYLKRKYPADAPAAIERCARLLLPPRAIK